MSGRTPQTPDERRERDSVRGKRAHDALLARFEREVDPDGVLDPAERARLAQQARTAHFRRIGQKGAAASAQSKNTQRRAREAPAPVTTRRPSTRALGPADWAQLWEQPDMQAVLSARDVSRVYRALKDVGVTQRQIAELTGQSQPEVSDICNGRQVRDVTVLERICDGLGIPRPLMRLLGQAPGQDSAYSEEVTVTDPAEGDEMLRRDLLAQGAIVLVGAPVLGALLGADAGAGVGPGPLPSQVGTADVAEIATTTEQLRAAARTQGGQARAVTATALEYGRLRQVPAASAAVATALGARLAELMELAGWCWHDSGDDHRARWYFRQAAGLARQAGDQIRVASALRFAAIVDSVRDRPDDALKLHQLALEIAQHAKADPEAIAWAHQGMAYDFAAMGRHDQAIEHLARARDGWASPSPYERADMDYSSALIQVLCGRLDVAEALVARVNGGGRHRPVGVMAGVLRATIHVQTGEPRGLVMANEAIRAVAPLRSVRARQKLVPLVQALDARPGSDAQDLARMARQVAV